MAYICLDEDYGISWDAESRALTSRCPSCGGEALLASQEMVVVSSRSRQRSRSPVRSPPPPPASSRRRSPQATISLPYRRRSPPPPRPPPPPPPPSRRRPTRPADPEPRWCLVHSAGNHHPECPVLLPFSGRGSVVRKISFLNPSQHLQSVLASPLPSSLETLVDFDRHVNFLQSSLDKYVEFVAERDTLFSALRGALHQHEFDERGIKKWERYMAQANNATRELAQRVSTVLYQGCRDITQTHFREKILQRADLPLREMRAAIYEMEEQTLEDPEAAQEVFTAALLVVTDIKVRLFNIQLNSRDFVQTIKNDGWREATNWQIRAFEVLVDAQIKFGEESPVGVAALEWPNLEIVASLVNK